LGRADALDSFASHGSILSKAIAPAHLLHIVSGNTPHAAIQSLLRGLLLGSANTVKLPSTGLPELSAWVAQFPESLKNLITLLTQLKDTHWQQADAIIAIGSDQTMLDIQQKITPRQRFIPHGHKISIGIVCGDFETAAPLAARDASLYNQRGCLSPHAIYVQEQTDGDTIRFASLLAKAMDTFGQTSPPEPLTLSEAGAIHNLRETTRFTAANTDTSQLWESPHNQNWTVICESSPTLKLSCLNRCIYVKPLPASMDAPTLGTESQHLSTIAIHPFSPTYSETLLNKLPATRICPLGQSQSPSLFWHHDGFAPLASLVQWQDIG